MPDILLTKSEKYFLSHKGYKLFKTIGLGTDSKIYLANYENPETSNRYYLACKVYDTNRMHQKYAVKFLPRELEMLVNISNPHIIQVHSIFQWKSRYYIFMRYAERGDLFDYIKDNGCIEEIQAKIWFKQLCNAVKYLHSLDIAHRDLKCENVLITRNFNIKLADFGFSRSCQSDEGEVLCETYCGSLLYTSPEIIRGKPYLAKPADMWSLGIILYVMVNRTMPFYEENIKKLYELQMNQKWKFKSKVIDELSIAIKSLISTLLLPDPGTRFTINNVFHSEWISQERISVTTPAEFTAPPSATTSGSLKTKIKLKKKENSNMLQIKAETECVVIKDISEVNVSDPELLGNESIVIKKKRKCCII